MGLRAFKRGKAKRVSLLPRRPQNAVFAGSSPSVMIFDMTIARFGLLRTDLGTSMPSGGAVSSEMPPSVRNRHWVADRLFAEV